jgi:hypothetical protein
MRSPQVRLSTKEPDRSLRAIAINVGADADHL